MSVAVDDPNRDERGRFVKGNVASPGKMPYKHKGEEYRNVLYSECSLEDWAEIVKKAVVQAKLGNRYAREWLGDKLLPEKSHQIDVRHYQYQTIYELIDVIYEERDALPGVVVDLAENIESILHGANVDGGVVVAPQLEAAVKKLPG